MKKTAAKVSVAGLILAAAVAAFFLFRTQSVPSELVLLPTDVYEIFPMTDSIIGGASTCELSVDSSSVEAGINIRSGTAYPYAGVGVNLLSVRHRPATGFFDFTKYDSIAVDVSSGRLRTVEVRFLNNDPAYSKAGDLLSYRPQVKTIPANGVTKFSLKDFRTPEWWLSSQGLEDDDFLSYFDRGVIFALVNGEGALRGIPDRIRINSVRLWSK